MTVVIDVGCAKYGGDYSIERLIEEFHPETLYGFDPNLSEPSETVIDGTRVCLFDTAAWTRAGTVGYRTAGLRGTVTEDARRPRVVCFDLAAFIAALPDEGGIVLKIDAEGAEYDLLEHLIRAGVDAGLAVAVVEWHPLSDGSHEERRESIGERIGCELREWQF